MVAVVEARHRLVVRFIGAVRWGGVFDLVEQGAALTLVRISTGPSGFLESLKCHNAI